MNLNCTEINVHKLASRGVIRRRYAHRPTGRAPSTDVGKRVVRPLIPCSGPDNPRGMRGHVAMFSLRDIEEYAARRQEKGRNRARSFNDPRRPFTPSRVYPPESGMHREELIRLAEAAKILDVRQSSVSNLVRDGTLKAYQRIAGRPGVPVWLSEVEVRRYANSPERQKRRRRYDEYRRQVAQGTWRRPSPLPYEPSFDEPPIYQGDANLTKDRGEYYTARQAAEVLGCSASTVKRKIRSGTLPGYITAKSSNPNDKWNDRRWWFLKKEEVHEYQASSEYSRRRRSYLAGLRRRAGWS